MKKMVSAFAVFIAMLCLAVPALAHSGRTDGNGGHYNRATGEYHYHHGYPAHQHPGGECPYDFHDNTDSNDSNARENDLMDGWLGFVVLIVVALGCNIILRIVGRLLDYYDFGIVWLIFALIAAIIALVALGVSLFSWSGVIQWIAIVVAGYLLFFIVGLVITLVEKIKLR